MTIIESDNLSKKFGKIEALKQVSFSIEEGELFGLIGPDGGKSTLFNILVTLLIPTVALHIMGYDLIKQYKEIRKIIGYLPGQFSLYKI